MVSPSLKPFAISVVFAGISTLVHGDVSVSALFSEHAVLQASEETPVWGRAAPGEAVAVSWGEVTASTQADENGEWRLHLDLSRESGQVHSLILTGKNRLEIPDVATGEVWLCGGQSNMQWPMSRTNGLNEELKRPADPYLRYFRVRTRSSETPLDDYEGEWVIASPENIGRFSGVAYHFGKELRQALHMPIGLVDTSIGGSAAETWVSAETLATDPDLKENMETELRDRTQAPLMRSRYFQDFNRWCEQYDRAAPTPGMSLDQVLSTESESWQTVRLPGLFNEEGLPVSGVIWLKKSVTISPDMEGRALSLQFGPINGYDTVYYNGHKVGETTPRSNGAWTAYRRSYRVQSDWVQAGPAEIVIRVYSPFDNGGFPGEPHQLFIGPEKLSGEWEATVEYNLPPMTEEARRNCPQPPPEVDPDIKIPTLLYNGMVHPISPYAIAGVIWYQGEANVGHAGLYRRLFPMVIREWRTRWGQGDFPFLYCQLANYGEKSESPGESKWAELREAQTMTLSVPNTGQAVLIESGAVDVHPLDKQTPGHRLGLLALDKAYSRDVASESPLYESMRIEGNAIRITFSNAKDGLKAQSSPQNGSENSDEITGFAIRGSDGPWVRATVKIEGSSVHVFSPQVEHPVAVRYGWANNPDCNLYNMAGLPVTPFRTDFPASRDSSQRP